MTRLVLRHVDLDGRPCDVGVESGTVTAIEPAGSVPFRAGDVDVDGGGGAVIPGLHDHHVHLLATAAAARSVPVGPAHVSDAESLGRVLRAAAQSAGGDSWVRAVDYHDAVAGPLDRWLLDALVGDRPVRVQHQSGVQWVLSSAACRAVGLDDHPPPGAGRDHTGALDGRLLREDRWLRERLPAGPPPDVGAVARRLNELGVTGVTDTTPFEDVADLRALLPATSRLRIQVTGSPALTAGDFPQPLLRGPVKVVLDEHDLPGIDLVTADFESAHRAGRAVAVHAVTRTSLVLALAAWEAVGSRPGDRLEHGSVIPEELVEVIRRLGLVVVTQPAFVAERGDRYLAEVDAEDVPHLYRCGSLLEAGVPVAASSDTPYSNPDPWRALAAAVDRRTTSGQVLGAAERVAPQTALGLFLGSLDDPGGPPRRVRVGVEADLVVLDAPLADVLTRPAADRVRHTVAAGRVVG